jgi:hypothetical protein
MKRLWAVALRRGPRHTPILRVVGCLLALALPALGQIRGIPSSVTSFGQNRGNTPGISASVTSLGPHGYGATTNRYSQSRTFSGYNYGYNNYNSMCSTPGALVPSAMGCISTSFTNQMYGLPLNTPPTNLRSRGGNQRGSAGGYYPVYVPYAMPVVMEEEPAPQPDTRAIAEDEANEPPALTVFERRSKSSPALVSKLPIDESRVYHPAPAAPAEAREERQAPAIVLIYKDGRQREVQNYAIMGNYLFDIGMFVAQKIPLAELNLKATLKANDERGVEFALPASVAP